MNRVLQRMVHGTLYALTRPFFVWAYIDPLYRPRTEPGSDRLPPPPFIMVSNHGTFLDPWIVGRYSHRAVFFMCNDDAWRSSPVTRFYLTCIGAFPKKKGGVDYRALKTTLKILEAGSPVCIFPEGQTSWTGETQLIYLGLEKLVKRAGVPLVMFNLCGNFLTKPWWAERRRRGRVIVRVRVLTAAQVNAMSDQELFDTLKTAIYQNDIKDERNRTVRFGGRDLALGLERLVWNCMHCGTEDHLRTSGDDIACDACGRHWRIDPWCRLTALTHDTATLPDLKDWCDQHRQRVLERINTAWPGAELTRSSGVTLQTLESDGYTFIDRSLGTLTLTAERLVYVAEGVSAERREFPVAEIRDVVIQKKDIVEFRYADTYWRFVVAGRSPMKWVYYLRYLKGYEECERRGYL